MSEAKATVAGTVADVLVEHRVERVFGVPGGGSNLEIIDACAARGIDYVLAHTETAAAIMAAVTGELAGTPGVVATALGPGAAAARAIRRTAPGTRGIQPRRLPVHIP